MKVITKQDIPKFKNQIAIKSPAERHVLRLWASFEESMESTELASDGDLRQALRIIQFVAKKTETILVDEVGFRGVDETMNALARVSKIRSDAEALLEALGDVSFL